MIVGSSRMRYKTQARLQMWHADTLPQTACTHDCANCASPETSRSCGNAVAHFQSNPPNGPWFTCGTAALMVAAVVHQTVTKPKQQLLALLDHTATHPHGTRLRYAFRFVLLLSCRRCSKLSRSCGPQKQKRTCWQSQQAAWALQQHAQQQ
jgi:hypothetical protein